MLRFTAILYQNGTKLKSYYLWDTYITDARLNVVKDQTVTGIFVGDKFESDLGVFKSKVPNGLKLTKIYNLIAFLIYLSATIAFSVSYAYTDKWPLLLFAILCGIDTISRFRLLYKFCRGSKMTFKINNIQVPGTSMDPEYIDHSNANLHQNPPPYMEMPIPPPPYKEEGSV